MIVGCVRLGVRFRGASSEHVAIIVLEKWQVVIDKGVEIEHG